MDDSTMPLPMPGIPPGTQPAALPREREHIDLAQVEFVLLYQAEKPLLIRFLVKLGARREDALDIAQDTFEDLYKSWGGNIRNPAAWLRRVAYLKFMKKTKDNLILGDYEDVSGNDLPIAELADLTDQQQRVIALIRALPPTQRLVFVLYYDEFMYTEIAKMLSMKEAAVRQNLARARAALKKSLGR